MPRATNRPPAAAEPQVVATGALARRHVSIERRASRKSLRHKPEPSLVGLRPAARSQQPAAGLPRKPCRHLDLPRLVRALDYAEVRVQRASIHADLADRVVEVVAVEDVVKLRPQAQVALLAERD